MKTFCNIMIIVCAIMVAACFAWFIYGICVKEASIIAHGALCAVVNSMSLVLFIVSKQMYE